MPAWPALALALLCAPALAQAPADAADTAETMQAAEAAVARLGEARGRSLTRSVRDIPGLATGTGAGTRGLEASVQELESAKRELGASESDLEVRVALPADVLFDVDRAEIRADAASALAQLATVIRGYSGPVLLIGHTDADGSEEHNLALSQRRAESVHRWLAEREGIDTARMRTEGRGESEPVAANDSPDGKQRNRRVEAVIGKR